MDIRFLIKVLLTATVVVGISEVAKRSTAMGSILAALPLTSLLALTWLYLDTKDRGKVEDLSMGIFWAVIPSLIFFVLLATLMRTNLPFGVAMLIAAAVTVVAYLVYVIVLKRFGITF